MGEQVQQHGEDVHIQVDHQNFVPTSGIDYFDA